MMRSVFLKCSKRRKDGKVHRSWSVVESRRYAGGKVAQRHVLYLGEINDSQRLAWEKSIAVFDEHRGEERQLALFPADRTPPQSEIEAVQVRLSELELSRPRQWGACWLADRLWRTLHFDQFFGPRLPVNREGTDWEKVLRIVVIYRLLSPGSEWRLHRHWFGTTALADLLDVDDRSVQDDTLYRCHDLLLEHKEDLFKHLRQRWSDLFAARYEVLLYDLYADLPIMPKRWTWWLAAHEGIAGARGGRELGIIRGHAGSSANATALRGGSGGAALVPPTDADRRPSSSCLLRRSRGS